MRIRFLFVLLLLCLTHIGSYAYDFYHENSDGSVVYLNDVTQFEFQLEVGVVDGAMNSNAIITIRVS